MKKFKDIVKKNPEPARGTNFTNPSQLGQYSAKHQVAESATLNQYLQSKGIDPQYVSKDTKIAHSKSNAFLKWKERHMNEDMTTQRKDGDARSLDIHSPTLRRQKSLQKVASHYTIKPVTTHPHQNPIKGEASQTTKLTPEEVTMEDTKKQDPMTKAWNNRFLLKQLLSYLGITETSMKSKVEEAKLQELSRASVIKKTLFGEAASKDTALEKFRKASAEREKKHADIEKKQSKDGSGMSSAIDRLQKQVNKEDVSPLLHSLQKKADKKHDKDIEKFVKGHKKGKLISAKEEVEQIDEISKSTLASYKDKSTTSLKNAQANRDAAEAGKYMSKGFADLHKKSDDIAKKRVKGLKGYLQRKVGMKPTSEDVGDAKAATNADGLPNAQLEPVSEKKKQLSKSARMIKALYKNKRMVKEDMYDHEKEDKSVATYGKKPKHEKADEKDSHGEKKPQAAAVLTGGTTLTGEKRDDVEIDPMMRNRPGQPDVTKKDDKDKKKEDKKKDK